MKPITERIDSISIIKNGNKYGREYWFKKETMIISANEGNKSYPIVYIHRPKNVSLKDWNIIKDKLEITMLK